MREIKTMSDDVNGGHSGAAGRVKNPTPNPVACCAASHLGCFAWEEEKRAPTLGGRQALTRGQRGSGGCRGLKGSSRGRVGSVRHVSVRSTIGVAARARSLQNLHRAWKSPTQGKKLTGVKELSIK